MVGGGRKFMVCELNLLRYDNGDYISGSKSITSNPGCPFLLIDKEGLNVDYTLRRFSASFTQKPSSAYKTYVYVSSSDTDLASFY